ncbi:integrin alpha-D-like isoform X2 [Antechinus flavipes]|uniref:integrin alpha-D-like isoform X2 n=1 Tax=Antechinus flavipes TaxID=38775 RepID=UPI002236154D|nr:integrin alpha-D-like isoform X2 [Antechinus flavipes]
MAAGAVFLITVLASSHGFNLDIKHPIIFQKNVASFGQSVVQFKDSRLMVGAPLVRVSAKQTGRLYECKYDTRSCLPIPLQIPQEAVNMSLGLSLATGTNSSQLLVCGPTVHQTCGKNIYMKGFCFVLDSKVQQCKTIPETLQECPKQENDIVFLIDGSASINSDEFQQMKSFVRAVIDQFKETNTQFSLMQYSNLLKTHFTFADFQKSTNWGHLVDPISQLKGLTYTATAIRKVVTELFQSWNGARKNATKILIVITDGEKYKDELQYEDVIPQADQAGIIRYAIGVGDAFEHVKAREELNIIGSKPADEHVFRVNNFGTLKNIQEQLQEKIFSIEGTESRSSISFQHEMSQAGFSAVLTSMGPVLGAVGSFGWSGGVFLYSPNQGSVFIKPSKEDMHDAYLGYSAMVAIWNGVQKLVLGAPRYQHTGKVVVFTNVGGTWEQEAEVKGTQVGSYFGATLCPIDVNSDNNTDLILIGAPYYYEQNRGGQVYICPFSQQRAKWNCEVVLHGQQGYPFGRFGAALAIAGDTNGDKITDVVVGAPGEEENQGAIYLFHGVSGSGFKPSYSQRISGSHLSPTLQYFGQSLSGGQDLTQDGLVDVAVGAQEHVLLLRTCPILRVEVSITFTPPELARSVFECWGQKAINKEAGTAIICFTISKSTPDHLGDVSSSVAYDLALDAGRLSPRAIFAETKNWTLNRIKTLGLGNYCENVKLLLPYCVEDSVNPISLRLNFSLVGQHILSSENLRPVLQVGSQDLFTSHFPFEKNCGTDHFCEDDLDITFNFSGLQTLVVGSNLELNVTVTVTNQGEDSYRTMVTFLYPPGLSYRKVSVTQNWHPQQSGRIACEAAMPENKALKSTGCSINHPIFQEGAKVTFVATFDISPTATLGDKMLMKTKVSSENNTPKSNKTTFQLEVPVKYAIYLVISSKEESTKYLNFSASEEKKSQEVKHKYQVNNLSKQNLPSSINFWVPVELNKMIVWNVTTVNSPQKISCVSERSLPSYFDFQTQIQTSPVLDCSIAVCLKIRCDISSFGVQEQLDFTLKGNLSFGWVSQTLQKKLIVRSSAEIIFNESIYYQLQGQEAFLKSQTETVLEQYEIHIPILLIAGSTVGGLLLLVLITVGLFKVRLHCTPCYISFLARIPVSTFHLSFLSNFFFLHLYFFLVTIFSPLPNISAVTHFSLFSMMS